jgi:WhiB family redox-sensing transcriptional regulator
MVTEAINLMDTQLAPTGFSGPGFVGSELTAPGVDDELLDAQDVELSWQERALCAQTDPEAFFPEKGGSTREAKKVCLGCDVRGECLEYALAHDERFGIWGGLSERERRRLKKEAV